MLNVLFFLWLCWPIACTVSPSFRKPNIVLMMVDDMGWNDVSYHGSNQLKTPNIDSLAYFSTILEDYYSEAICTPARTAFLTGKYPLKLGMYGIPLGNLEDRGIPLTERLLPSYLKEQGYTTHLIGKWHVGMSRRRYLPTARGYNTHYGIRGGAVDYYTYIEEEPLDNGDIFYGFDFFDNDVPQYGEERYIVQALTDRAVDIIKNHNSSQPLFLHVAHNAPHVGNNGAPLQPPLYSPVKNSHIFNSNRRLYASIISSIDASFGKIVETLFLKNILDNTIIIFLSDNGAPTVGQYANWGVNFPFRGIKYTPWEGGVRVPAFIWHPSIKPKVWRGLMHITDWLATLISAAGGTLNKEIDGINQWNSIKLDLRSQREDVLVTFEERGDTSYSAFRAGDHKIILGNVSSLLNGFYGEDFLAMKSDVLDYYKTIKTCPVANVLEKIGYSLNNDTISNFRKSLKFEVSGLIDQRATLCEPTPDRGCLYNIRQDPSELYDLWDTESKLVTTLRDKLRIILSQKKTRAPFIFSADADPANFNYTWMPWIKEENY